MSRSQSPHHVRCDPEKQTEADGQRYHPRSAPDQTSQRLSPSCDTAIPLLTLYLRTTEGHDRDKLKSLKGDTDQILVFCGLFSATVAALIVPTLPVLTDFSSSSSPPSSPSFTPPPVPLSFPEPSGTPAPLSFPEPSGTPSTLLPTAPLDLSSSNPNGPPNVIFIANAFWLWSLFLSVSCAIVALSLQRCAQPRTRVTLPHYDLHDQTRLRTLFAAGFEKRSLDFLIGALHGLVHIAVAAFLAGLHLYFWAVSFHGFWSSMVWSVLCFVVYVWLTLLPIIRPGSPYSTPFSNIITAAYVGVLHGTSRLLYLVTRLCRVGAATPGAVRHPMHRFYNRYKTLIMSAEKRLQELAPQLDDNVLKQTLDILRSDDDLEQFFEAIPGFCDSKIIDSPQRSLDMLGPPRLAEALVEFWNRTLSSNRISESVKGRRLVVCMRVIEATNLSFAVPRILDLFGGDIHGVSRSVETGHSLGIVRKSNTASLARGIIASIISTNDDRDERWFTLAMDELDIPEDVLRRYLDHGDSVLLANLIHITRQFFQNLLQRDSDLTRQSLRILPSVSKFDILNTLPELQHDFCALWNEIVQQAQSNGTSHNPFIGILVEIRGLYVALHGVDAALTYFFASSASPSQEDLFRQPASYPLCMMSDHRNLTSHIQEGGGSTIGEASHSTITSSPVLLSKSSPGDVLDVPQHVPTLDPSPSSGRHDPIVTATVIAQVIVDPSLSSSMAQPIARSPSGTGDALRPDGEITGLESPSSAPENALSYSNPQAATIVLDQSIQNELIHHPENTLTSQQPDQVVPINSARPSLQ